MAQGERRESLRQILKEVLPAEYEAFEDDDCDNLIRRRFTKLGMLRNAGALKTLRNGPDPLPEALVCALECAAEKVAAGPGTGGAFAPRRLSDSEVLSQLRREYQAPVMVHIQDQSSSLSRRQEPIMPDADGVVEELGPCLNLEGYAVFALRALIALLVLQSRSNKVKSGDSNRENQDDKFACGTQILRIVGAPGTGKTTALTFLWRYIYDHLDELLAKLPGCDNHKISHLRERIQNSLRLDLFLCFTFSNAGLEQLLREEGPAMTGAFMATRMLYAMVGEAGWTYQTFLQQMDAALRLSLEPRHLMQFIQSAAGLGQKRGLVVFNFDECGAPKPEAPGQPTYFQRGLSDLVPWRWEEAVRRFKDGAEARDLLPVVVISGTHSARMNLLQTASGKARIFNLGRPMLRDESLVSIAMDAVRRIARATGTAVPGSAEEILRMLTAWLGWNPRALVATLCFAGGASTPKQVHVGRLWEFLQLPPGARLDRVYAVLQKVEDHLKASNWAFWLLKAGEKDREALFYHAFAHSITGRPVARAAHIPGGNQSWADAESDGFIGLTDYRHEIQWRSGLQLAAKGDLSDPDSPPKPGKAGALGPSSPVSSAEPSAIDDDEGEAAPDFLAVACVHIPPLLLRVMYQQLSAVWSSVRSLQQFPESWEDREQSDLGLLMLRLQLAGSVFGERTMQLEELCPGLSTLGEVFIPTGDYVIHRVTQQLKAPGFAKACLEKAQVGGFWAFMGPGNWGPDSWLILIRVDGEKIILYVQSKKRIMGALQYPEAALDKETGKCWDVPGVPSSMLYLTDERGRDEDNALIETSSGVTVVPVSRHARDVAYGVAMATVKRSREAIEQAGRGKKPKT